MLEQIPAEISIAGVYFPPLFFTIIAGLLSAYIISVLLNKTNLSRYFFHPPLVFFALTLLMTSLIGLTIFSP